MRQVYYGVLVLLFTMKISVVLAAQHQHGAKGQSAASNTMADIVCDEQQPTCAKTVTVAIAPNGDIWRVWSLNQKLFYQVSQDKGNNFGETKQVDIAQEKISARNENRPKIGFDKDNGVYFSWAMSREKRFTADVRFSYSTDGGKTFTQPITVNNDGLLAGHSFNEMKVSPDGEVTLVWLDGRRSYKLRKQGKEPNGSELYLAKGNPRKNIAFTNDPIATGTCQCCRIALASDSNDNLSVFWRHIFGDNVREFALITLDEKQPDLAQVQQISQDHWYIEGCPHQGGALSIDTENRYHMTWYNQGSKGKGIFYAQSQDAGKTLSTPTAIGNPMMQAAHPNMTQRGNIVEVVWMEMSEGMHQLWYQKSQDNGKTFLPATKLATSNTGADRPFIISGEDYSVISWQRPKTGHWIQAR